MNDQANNTQDKIIRTRARESFENSVAGLDQATSNRLRLMRREALSAARTPARAWGLPLAASAVAVLALGLVWRTNTNPAMLPTPAPADTGEEISATGFPSEEDADLYAWLGEAPVAPAQGKTL
jgi:hypothetical protein